MHVRTLLAVLLLTLESYAQNAKQILVASLPCEQLQPKAQAFLEERRWKLSAPGPCALCILATTDALRDAGGHRLLSRGGIVRSYTTRTTQPKPPGPAWIVHSPIHVVAKLTLEPVSAACKTKLTFEYSWYGAELMLGFPIDGDPDRAPSNGRLESEYLERFTEELQSFAKPPSR